MSNRKVTLSKPIQAHAIKRELWFREPTWRVIMEVGGEPYVRVPSPNRPGYFQIVPVWERVQSYAEKLIAAGEGEGNGDVTDLLLLGIEDTDRVKDAILGFFLDADPSLERRPKDAGLTTSPPNSPTTSGGDAEISST